MLHAQEYEETLPGWARPTAGRFRPTLLALLLIMTVTHGLTLGAAVGTEPGGTEYYISSASGKDTNTGASREAAFRTLKAAVEKAPAGATITLLPGWYEGGVTLKAGTEGRPTVL